MLKSARAALSSAALPVFLLLALIVLTGAPGCIVGDFISVYFNTLYNAKHLFSEAEEEFWNLPETKLSGKNYLVTAPIQQSTKTKFSQVIEKCSKLLQYHPDSRYVDDALMMIGKSYYYEGDFQQAERKFKELISREPESGYVTEAKYLLAYSCYEMNSLDEARTLAKDVLETGAAAGDDNAVARASLVLGELEIRDHNFETARDDFEQTAQKADNNDFRASIFFRIAWVDSTIQDFAGSEGAYRRAADASSNYVNIERGLIGAARMERREGHLEDSIDDLRGLRANQNNREFFGEIELELGNCFAAKNDTTEAIRQYRRVDSLYARTDVAARACLRLGLLYERQLCRYDSARAVFMHGAQQGQMSEVGPILARRAEYLSSYFRFQSEIAKNDSIRAAELAKRDSLRAVPDTLAAGARPAADSTRPRAVTPILSLDSLDLRIANGESELAGLFYTTLGRTDSALFWYTRIIEEHPGSPPVPRALFTVAQIYSLDTTRPREVSDSLSRLVAVRYPETEFGAEARRLLGMPPEEKKTDSAATVYARGEQLILSGNGTAALDTMRAIISSFPGSPYASKAQYASGWIYENLLQQPDSALSTYRRLVERYPASIYASRVRPLIAAADFDLSAKPTGARKDTVLPAPQAPPHEVKSGAPQPPEPQSNRQGRLEHPPEETPPPHPPGGGQDRQQ